MVFKRTRVKKDGKIVEYPHYWYRFMRNGVWVCVNTKQPNKRAAEELETTHRTRLAKGDAGIRDARETPTLRQFQERFLEAIEARCGDKPGTVKFYRGYTASLLAFKPMADARLDRIDEAMIEKFVQWRRKQVAHQERKTSTALVTPATVNRSLATLRRALRLAQEWKLIDRVPRIRLLPGEHEREFVLSREQEPAYLAACPEPLHDVALLILDTGLRVGEATKLEWRDVHIDAVGGAKHGYLQVRKGKSRNARRTISLTSRVVEMLRKRAETITDQFVFTQYTDTYLAHLHQRVREKLGWSGEFVVHSLRHTMLTRLGEAGVDAFTIMKIAGHGSITVSQRYVHPTPESLERAFEKLEASNAPEQTVCTLFAHDAPEQITEGAQVVN